MHVGKYFHPFKGGIENMLRELIDAQKRSGISVSAVVHHHQARQSFNIENSHSATLYRLPIMGQLLYVPLAITALYYLKIAIKREKPDVLHLHLPNATCFWLLMLPEARKIPWVVHWHSDVIGQRPDWRLKLFYPVYRLFEQAILAKSKWIITTSDRYRHTSEPLSKWHAKINSVPLGLIDKPQICKPTKDKLFTVLCVGRLTYYKGQQFLVSAINALKKKNIVVRLKVVGSGESKDKLLAQVKKLNLEDCVEFHQGVSDEKLLTLIQGSTLLCLPSIERTEAFGLVLLEAMRAAKPCICTNVEGSGMSYVVEHEKTGLVVDAESVSALSEGIERFFLEPELIEQYGLAGRGRFLRCFTVEKTANEISEIYRKIRLPTKE